MKCNLLTLAFVLALSSVAGAAVPGQMSYQGYLEEDGAPVTGTRDLVFALYAQPYAGTVLWQETHTGVAVDRGVFSVELGLVTVLTPALFDRPAIYLETRVGGVPLTPRRKIDSVPYTLRADEAANATAAQTAVTAQTAASATHAAVADSAVVAAHAVYADSCGSGGGGGGDTYWSASGANIYNNNSGNVGIGTSTPAGKLHVVASNANPAVRVENVTGTPLYAGGMGRAMEAWASGNGAITIFGGADAISGTTTGISGYAASPNGRAVFGQVASTTGTPSGVLGEASAPDGYGVAGKNLATTGSAVGVYGTSASSSGSGVYGINSAAGTVGFGVQGEASSSTGCGVKGKNTAATGWAIGALGTSASSAGAGVYGSCGGTAGFGVYGSSSGGSGTGVHGSSTGASGTGVYGSSAAGTGVKGLGGQTGVYGEGTVSGGSFFVDTEGPSVAAVRAIAEADENIGLHAEVSGVGSRAVYGVSTMDNSLNSAWGGYFLQAAGMGAAVYGEAGTLAAGTYSNGGQFLTRSPGGFGVYGENEHASSESPGVYGRHAVTDNHGIGVYGDGGDTGVKGEVTANGTGAYYGVHGTVSGTAGSGRGVYGAATASGTNYGVYGYAASGTSNYAGYFSGNVTVNGTLSKSAGSFKIDHPLDPTGKYLLHSFVESPDMKNVYDGVAVLDGRGEAIVTLPDWFEALNRDFRYQLTCIGGYAPVYIAEEVRNNAFRIAGGQAGLRISWQVTGIRQDPYAEANRIPVEMEKPLEEQGTYLHPEAHGASSSLQVDRVLEAREPGR